MERGDRLSRADREEIAEWIAARHGKPGAYANTFAGFDVERRDGIRLFTGERVSSASARHLLGQESCRALLQLDARSASVRGALASASEGLMECIARAAVHPRGGNPGLYCCGKCSVGLWRHLAVGGLDRQAERLNAGIQSLRERRDEKSGWRAYPFWYTVLVLEEVRTRHAKAELRHAAKVLERAAARSASSVHGVRRRAIASRALDLL